MIEKVGIDVTASAISEFRPPSFTVKDLSSESAQVVQYLAGVRYRGWELADP
ncbi:hypothetical protein [Streptomyces sp. 1222.5]|uniref:hypothetical protein n=1 Tax=Streptomyces sp. 1222.5 TaxID=1881026 RepID=UPI003EC07A1E